MARQIIDLPEMNPEQLAESDLIVVRDYDQKKDKKMPIGSLKTSYEVSKKIEELDDGEYFLRKDNGDVVYQEVRKEFAGYGRFICKTGSGRTTSASGTHVGVGVPFEVVNESDLPIKVGIAGYGMIQHSNGVARLMIKDEDTSTSIGRYPYVNPGTTAWIECVVPGVVIVPPQSTKTYRMYMFRESGTATATVCDKAADAGNYGVYVRVSFEGFVQE